MKAWTATEIESVADDLEFVVARLREVSADMKRKPLKELVLQADTAFGLYRTALLKIAGDAPVELRDQFRCKQTGETPRWQLNQRTIALRKAKKAAKPANDAATGQSSVPAVKKPAKKKKGTT